MKLIKTKNAKTMVQGVCPNCNCKVGKFVSKIILQEGDGFVDDILKATKGMPIGVIGEQLGVIGKQRFPEEGHIQLDNKTASFAGPGTRLSERLNPDDTPVEWSKPVNALDELARIHDIAYRNNKDARARSLADLNLLNGSKEIYYQRKSVDALKLISAMYGKLQIEAPDLLK
jgi:hypothetical protein